MTSSKQRLRLAHQLLDRQLQNSSFSKKANSQNPDSTNFWSFEGKKQSTGKAYISDVEKKLLELEKKMQNISCSSDPDDSDIYVRKPSKQKQASPQPLKFSKKQFSEDEDSEDDVAIYKKLQKKSEKQVIKNQPAPKKVFQEQPKPIIQKESKHSLRDSVKSIKSIKSRNSNYSQNSKYSNKKNQKLIRSNSKSSIGSRRSLGKSANDIRQLQIENAKDAKKISNLQKQILHYKRLCQTQKRKLQEYRVMEIEFKKLQNNFNKSEQVRKQQKKIIESLKSR